MRNLIAGLTVIQAAVERCFAEKRAQPLYALLGFPDAPIIATALSDVLPCAERCWFHGARGVLAAYSFGSSQRSTAAEIARIAHRLRVHNPAQLQVYLFADPDYNELVIGSFGMGAELLTLTLQRGRLHASDLECLQEMLPADAEVGVALAARHGRALDRSRITDRFFRDFAAQRDAVSASWLGIPQQRRARNQLSLLLLSRLMFLYFLQHRLYLAGDRAYLPRRLRAFTRHPHATTFYRATLRPLFFRVLNCRPEKREPGAMRFGDLPYLNGGLFARHLFERKHPRLDLPDACINRVFSELLERYRFTAREPGDAAAEGVRDVGVDPEMLGRVFEGLMAERTRELTGTFYTPARTVDSLVRESLNAYLAPRLSADSAEALAHRADASGLDEEQRRFADGLLEKIKVLDPACGSGAFLLGSLSRIAQARHALSGVDVLAIRRDLVAHNLYGVDLQNDAAQLCALRLWLALVPEHAARETQPLPNLDRQIRQGDSLVDAIDLRASRYDTTISRHVAHLTQVGAEYVASDPEKRTRLHRSLQAGERALARAWISALKRRIHHQTAELRAISKEQDLFGDRTPEARAADDALRELQERKGELRSLERGINAQGDHPFFSYAVQFADAAIHGFDLVVCNPPWVRSHNWTAAVSALVRRRFEVCRAAAWQPPLGQIAASGGKQIDLALLFLERAIQLLSPGGVLGILLPAKFMRSLAGAAARRLLLREMEIVSIEDHSLDQRSIFQAAAFATVLVARKRHAVHASAQTAVTIVHRKRDALRFTTSKHELPLITEDPGAPWLVVPPDVRAALRQMSQAPRIGLDRSLPLRRGVVTGANQATVLTRFEPRLGGLATMRAQGYEGAAEPRMFEAVIEQCAARPLVRGADIDAWRTGRECFLLCRTTSMQTPRALRYVASHKCSMPVVRMEPSPMLVWQDIASDMRAAVVPAGVVALNTVYFIPCEEAVAHLLCAYFNSLPFRTFARALAERAKDAHFRFFAWTVSLIPLPAEWRTLESARLIALSHQAHEAVDAEITDEITSIVSRAYGLTRSHMRALRSFDEWLVL